ncbi:DUF5777 family beta-barrel protein [Gracilimonas halophila]
MNFNTRTMNMTPKHHGILYTLFLTIVFLAFYAAPANAQLTRERTVTDQEVERTFWAPVAVGISTVQNPDGKNMMSSVVHTFGLTNGGLDTFFGMDDGANTKLNIDYGISDRLSVGIGRMTFNKVVDLRTKVNLLRQTRSGSMPLDVAVKASMGINTLSGLNYTFEDRLSYFASVMAARKMDRFSLQLTPMVAHFNNPVLGSAGQLYGMGVLMQYEINERLSLNTEYLPVLGDRNAGTSDAMAIALNIDTGGHIFQLFFTSSQWHNEQFIMANNRDRFWEGDFRFGFNIHRVFGFGGK